MESIVLEDFKPGEYYRIDLQNEEEVEHIFCQMYCVLKIEVTEEVLGVLTVLPIGAEKTINILMEKVVGFVHLVLDEESGLFKESRVSIPELSEYKIHKGDNIKKIVRTCEDNWNRYNDDSKRFIMKKIMNVTTIDEHIYLIDEIVRFKKLFTQMYNKYMDLLDWKINFISEYDKAKSGLPQYIRILCDRIIYGRCYLNKKIK